MLKHKGEKAIQILTENLNITRKEKKVSEERNKAVFYLFIREGNYRGISLLYIVSKMYESIYVDDLVLIAENCNYLEKNLEVWFEELRNTA